MEINNENQYVKNTAKATVYFAFRNGPIKDLHANGKISDEEMKNIQSYMEGHLAYLFKVLLEENNFKKFNLIMDTMNKFYVNDKEDIEISDDGFDKIYEQIFPKVGNINLNIK